MNKHKDGSKAKIRKGLLSIAFALCLGAHCFAQQFWLTTFEFQGREKTGITSTPDNCLFAALTNGVIRSCNEGNNFDTVLIGPATHCIFSNAAGIVFAGGDGQVFMTADNGATWDSALVNTIYPVSKIVQNSQGNLFAITGVLTANGYEGDGIFFSSDSGQTWTQCNNGLGIYKCIEQIAIDKNDRLYIAAADELVTGNGGLFISENNGLLWEHIDVTVDGDGVINDQIKIANTWGISVSKSDSVYFSFFGTAVNTSVRLNTVKHISDVGNNSYWKRFSVVNSPTWWQDKLLNNIQFAQNGDKYSSVSGTINFGGTFFNKSQQTVWQKINYGLGVDINGFQNIQHFTELPNGRIFMVQTLDERVYYTDSSRIQPTSFAPDETPVSPVNMYPHPVAAGEEFRLTVDGAACITSVSVFDGMGKLLSNHVTGNSSLAITGPQSKGLYMVVVERCGLRTAHKLSVY